MTITQVDIDNGYIDDESEDGVCLDCKEHCSPSYDVSVTSDGVAYLGGECLSNCCGAKVWVP